MRRMVNPFSSSNLPALIVRRHVIMVNFDPLRAVILRDRVLLLVPDGADGVVLGLEKSVRGGIKQKVVDVFGEVELASRRVPSKTPSATNLGNGGGETDGQEEEYVKTDIAFELVCLDSVLQAACEVIDKEFRTLSASVLSTIDTLKLAPKLSTGQVNTAQEQLRVCKNEMKVLEGRTEGIGRAMEDVLEEDEDLALMNLTKLVTQPDKFIQPVSKTVLEEEGDEPELIIEAYSQQSQSTMNGLKLLMAQVKSTEELVMMQLDRNRNRLLAYNTLLSLLSACLASASLVGSFFGMNLNNKIENDDGAFQAVVWGTLGGAAVLGILMVWKMSNAGVF